MSQITKASFWFAICNCVSSGISFISMPFFTRLMSAEQYGFVTVYNSWLQLFAVFGTLNLAAGAFNNGMVHFPETRDRYSSSMQGLVLVTSLVTGVAAIAATYFFPGLIGLSPTYIPIMFVQIFANGVFALWSARQRYEYNYARLLAMTFMYAVCVTALAVLTVWLVPDDGLKATTKVLTSSIGSLLVAVVLIIATQRRCLSPVHLSSWKYAFFFSVSLIPHYLSLIILGQIDRVMIGDMVNESAAAYYAVAYTIGIALSIVSSALNSSMVPWQFEKIKKGDYDGLAARVTQLIAVLSVAGILFALISPEILYVAAPPEYQEAVVVIPPIIMGIVFTFIYNILSNYEFYFEANKFISVASSIAAVLNIALNFLLIPVFGYVAAAYTTVFCYGMLAFVHTLFSWKVCRDNVGINNTRKMFNPKQVWTLALVALAALLLSTIAYDYWLLRITIIIVIFMVIYLKRSFIVSLLKR